MADAPGGGSDELSRGRDTSGGDGSAPVPGPDGERAGRRTDPFDGGVDRRRLLASSAAVGATAGVAGCLGGDDAVAGPTVFAFNTGDRTVSVIDAEADEVVASTFVGTTASFPANQYGLPTGGEGPDTLWLNVDGGVTALDAGSLEEVTTVETGFGPNYPNATPDGDHLVVAAGGTTTLDPDPADPPDHAIVRVDADEDSSTFGDVTGEIRVGYAGPCDATLAPGGEYAFVPEIADESLAVVRVDPFEVASRVDVEPAGDGDALPFMATAGFGGDRLLVENGEGVLGPEGTRRGSESIWDVSDPERPEEVARITRDDGLPAAPITSEVGPDGDVAYLFTPGAGSATVLDLRDRAVVGEIDLGGSALSGTWGPRREKLYVPVQSTDEVAVVAHADRSVETTVPVGESPVGATAGTVRPSVDALGRVRAALASLGVRFGGERATVCPVNCHCRIDGHGGH